jgi:hypothetical protein
LGVTPSAWTSSIKTLEVAAGGALAFAGPFGIVGSTNGFFDGSNWIYKTTGAAAEYLQAAGQHQWFTAPSGTAGNAISFTQAMTLDASGNLGVGTTSPTQRLHLSVGTATALYTRIANSAGDCFIGVDSSGNTNLSADNSGNQLIFKTVATERARIDSSGNLLVGTTDSGAGTGAGFKFKPSGNGAGAPLFNIVTANSTNSSSSVQIYSTGAGAYRFYVGDGGTIFATSTVISAISDQRLKENVRDLDTGLDSIMALQPRRFDWKEGKGQDKKDVAGFIAQEFETVFPECVGTTKAGEDGIEYKNINHETLIPALVKAIQELNAKFEAYKASHP